MPALSPTNRARLRQPHEPDPTGLCRGPGLLGVGARRRGTEPARFRPGTFDGNPTVAQPRYGPAGHLARSNRYIRFMSSFIARSLVAGWVYPSIQNQRTSSVQNEYPRVAPRSVCERTSRETFMAYRSSRN